MDRYQNVKVFQTAYISIASLLHSDYQRFTIHAFLRSETDRFSLQKGPFRTMKRTVSQPQMALIEML